jgi:hypothetical protein
MRSKLMALGLLSAVGAIILAVVPIAAGAASPTFETHISMPPIESTYGGFSGGAAGAAGEPDEVFVNGGAYPNGTSWRLDLNAAVGPNVRLCIRLFDATAQAPVAGSEDCLVGAPYVPTTTTTALTTTSSPPCLGTSPGCTTMSAPPTTFPAGAANHGSGPSFALPSSQDAYYLQDQLAVDPPLPPPVQPIAGFTTVQLVATASGASPPILGEVRTPSLMGVAALFVMSIAAFLGARRQASGDAHR